MSLLSELSKKMPGAFAESQSLPDEPSVSQAPSAPALSVRSWILDAQGNERPGGLEEMARDAGVSIPAPDASYTNRFLDYAIGNCAAAKAMPAGDIENLRRAIAPIVDQFQSLAALDQGQERLGFSIEGGPDGFLKDLRALMVRNDQNIKLQKLGADPETVYAARRGDLGVKTSVKSVDGASVPNAAALYRDMENQDVVPFSKRIASIMGSRIVNEAVRSNPALEKDRAALLPAAVAISREAVILLGMGLKLDRLQIDASKQDNPAAQALVRTARMVLDQNEDRWASLVNEWKKEQAKPKAAEALPATSDTNPMASAVAAASAMIANSGGKAVKEKEPLVDAATASLIGAMAVQSLSEPVDEMDIPEAEEESPEVEMAIEDPVAKGDPESEDLRETSEPEMASHAGQEGAEASPNEDPFVHESSASLVVPSVPSVPSVPPVPPVPSVPVAPEGSHIGGILKDIPTTGERMALNPGANLAVEANRDYDLAIGRARAALAQGADFDPEQKEFLTHLSEAETLDERLSRVILETGMSPDAQATREMSERMRNSMINDVRAIDTLDALVRRGREISVAQKPAVGLEGKIVPQTSQEISANEAGFDASWRDGIITNGDPVPDPTPTTQKGHEDLLREMGFPQRPKLWPVMMSWPPRNELRMLLDAGADPAKMAAFHQGLMQMQTRMLNRAEVIDRYIRENNPDHDYAKTRFLGLKSKKPVEMALADPYCGIRFALLLDEMSRKSSLQQVRTISQTEMLTIDGGKVVASMDAVRVRKSTPSSIGLAIEEAHARGWGTLNISGDKAFAAIAIQKAREMGIHAEITIRSGPFGLKRDKVTVMPPPPATLSPEEMEKAKVSQVAQRAAVSDAMKMAEKNDLDATAKGLATMVEQKPETPSDAAQSYAQRLERSEQGKAALAIDRMLRSIDPKVDEIPETDTEVRLG